MSSVGKLGPWISSLREEGSERKENVRDVEARDKAVRSLITELQGAVPVLRRRLGS